MYFTQTDGLFGVITSFVLVHYIVCCHIKHTILTHFTSIDTKKRRNIRFSSLLYIFPKLNQDYIDKDYEEEAEVKIVRSKRFGIKPMDPEEACIQMELLGHNFYVFSNSETGEVNVVYKRKGNTYGLIEPELD